MLTAATTTTEYEYFMSDLFRFTPADIAHLNHLCADSSFAGRKLLLGERTDDEWVIIVGIAKCYLAFRRMPDFLRVVLDSKE